MTIPNSAITVLHLTTTVPNLKMIIPNLKIKNPKNNNFLSKNFLIVVSMDDFGYRREKVDNKRQYFRDLETRFIPTLRFVSTLCVV